MSIVEDASPKPPGAPRGRSEGALPVRSRLSAVLFFPGSNGNSSSWSSLALEGDLCEDSFSFPASDRLVQSRRLKADGSSTTNA